MSEFSLQLFPPELLTKIFKECFAEHPQFSTTVAPLVVTQVCRGWRHVALSDPNIWSTLHIVISPSHLKYSTPMVLAVSRWLSLSGTQPLFISLLFDDFRPISSDLFRHARELLTVLASHSKRFKSLSLTLPDCPTLLANLFNHPMHLLQTLYLDLKNWRVTHLNQINDLLHFSPFLRSFLWSNRACWSSWDDAFVSGIDDIHVPWNNLTHVILDVWITMQSSYTILRQCHSLISCELRRFGGGFLEENLFNDGSNHYHVPHLRPQIILPHLISLDIYCSEINEGLALLFDLLSCPSLRHFALTCGYVERVGWPQSAFSGLIRRSACKIQSLMFEFTRITEDDLIQCLEQCSSLTSLKLYDAQHDHTTSDTFMSMLNASTMPSTRSPLCPNLTTLVLHNDVQCSDGMLASTLRSRSRQSPSCTTPLEIIDIHVSPKTNVVDYEYVLRMKPGITTI